MNDILVTRADRHKILRVIGSMPFRQDMQVDVWGRVVWLPEEEATGWPDGAGCKKFKRSSPLWAFYEGIDFCSSLMIDRKKQEDEDGEPKAKRVVRRTSDARKRRDRDAGDAAPPGDTGEQLTMFDL